jgi:hypothetical protein
MTIGEVLFAILTGLAINECCEISPWAARKLVRWSASHRYVDPARADIRAEELAALTNDLPGKLFKLITALGFAAGAIASVVSRAIVRRTPTIVQLVKKLVPRLRSPLAPLLTGSPVVLLDTSSHGSRAIDRLGSRFSGPVSDKRAGFVNDLECEWVLAACKRINAELRQQPGQTATVSVLTYYGAQAYTLRQLLGAHRADFPAIRFQVVGTIGEAMGQESDFAIVSFCRASRSPHPWSGFLSDLGRLNVMMTRARQGLILVGHAQSLRQVRGPVSGPLSQLLDSALVFHELRGLAK